MQRNTQIYIIVFKFLLDGCVGGCGIVGHDLGISKNPGYSPECNWPKVKMTSLQLASDWRKLNLQLTPDAKAPQQHYAQFTKREMPL